ncbi:hypothetical protein KCV05_g17, partial [Aureobasidium melanogenum]
MATDAKCRKRVATTLPELPRRRLWLVGAWSAVGRIRIQFSKFLRIFLFLLLTAQLSRSLQTSFLLFALDLLAIDNLHGACHAFLFGQTLVLAVLVHAGRSNDEGSDCPVGGRLNGCCRSLLDCLQRSQQ